MKTAAAYSLLMAIVMATMSTTTSEPICSRHESRRQCHSNSCLWLRRNRTCVPSPTEEECDSRMAVKSCRLIGCKWNFDATKCYVKPDKTLDQSSDSMDEPREERDVPDEEREERDISDEEASDKMGEQRDSMDDPDEEASDKMGVERDDPDEEREERDDPDEETSDKKEDEKEYEDDSGFWISMIGMDADEAIESITNKFGDYYRIFKCGRESRDVQCSMRNFDYQRVKLIIDENRRVEMAAVG